MTTRPLPLLLLAHVLAAVTLAFVAVTVVGGVTTGQSVLDNLPFVVLLMVTLVVGWILSVRLPRHPVGWILAAIPALFTLGAPLNLLESALHDAAPGVAQWIDWYNGTSDNPSWSWVPPVWLLLVQLPLRFPDGRLPSPRWRWFSWVTVVALAAMVVFLATANPHVAGREPNPAYLPAVHGILSLLYPVCFGLFAVCFITAIASLFVRYHHAREREREQLRWMLWGVALAILGLVLGWLLPANLAWLTNWTLALYSLIPIAIAVAVLRYRLYEIDRIISRTAAWAVVTLIVVGTYAVIVVLVSLLLPGLPSVATALATVAAAAVFLPVLRLVRRSVDRLFNRAQYNAERVVDAFGERVRNGADPHSAGIDLATAVQRTLQPSAVGIWTPGGQQ